MVVENVRFGLLAAVERDFIVLLSYFPVEASDHMSISDCQRAAIIHCKYSVIAINRNVGNSRSEADLIGAGAVIGDNIFARRVNEKVCALAAG